MYPCSLRFLNNRELAHASFSLHRLLDEPRLQLICCLLDTHGDTLLPTFSSPPLLA